MERRSSLGGGSPDELGTLFYALASGPTRARNLTYDMVLEMLSNTGEGVDDGNTSGAQDVLGTDTRVEKDVWGTDGTTSKDDLLGDVDSETGRVPVSGVLDGVRGEVVAGAGEEDPRHSGVREDGEVGPWWEGVDVSRTRVRTRPVRGVDGRGSNESTPTLSTVGVGRHRDTNVLEGGRPVTDDRDDAARKDNN